MERILKLYPASEETGNSLLLVGEYLADLSQPTNALAVFQRFDARFPRFAAATAGGTGHRAHLRTGAKLAGGHRKIRKMAGRISRPTRCSRRRITRWPVRIFRRETRRTPSCCSPILSRNFRRTTSRRWRNGGWPIIFSACGRITSIAEKNYKLLFQKPLAELTDLAYQARLMAGRAAMGAARLQRTPLTISSR